MPLNTTYLLGAGASRFALPIFKIDNQKPFTESEFYKELTDFRNSIPNSQKYYPEQDKVNAKSELNNNFKFNIDHLKNNINWILEELSYHVSADTIAKKFYLSGDPEKKLPMLKSILSLFFIKKQLYDRKVDYRYDTFFATILERQKGELKLPSHMKIISWNYDIQPELSFAKYCLSNKLSEIQKKLNTFPSIFAIRGMDYKPEEFGIVRLNGIAGLHENTDSITTFFENISKFTGVDFVRLLIASFEKYNIDNSLIDTLFTYSWERGDHKWISSFALDQAKAIAKQTEVLVIVGYSFPNFNRLVDVSIFKEFDLRKLKYVFIQDPAASEIKNLIEEQGLFEIHQYSGIDHIPIYTDTFATQFKIPF